jgi:hypothetical protein
MTDTTRIRLAGHGLLNITSTDDAARGAVTYRFTAPHAAGAAVLTPCHTHSEHKRQPLPGGVRIQFGTGERWPESKREDLPTVYGVKLVSGVILDPIEYLCRDEYGRWLRYSRPTGPYTSRWAPDATTKYMSKITAEILIVWLARPDLGELVRTVARREAPGRLAELARKVTARREEIAAAHADIAELDALADQLRAAVGDHLQHDPAASVPS